MSAALGLAVAVIWFIVALVWLWEWWRARAMLKPLVKEMQQAIRDCEAARWGLSSDYKSAVERPHTDYKSAVGTICPRCAKTIFIEIKELGSLRYCGYCGAPLVAR